MGNCITSRNEKLRCASFRGDYDEVVRLIEAGADVNYADIDRQTPLIKASIGSNTKICRYLLDKGANINQVDNSGCTAIHYACMGGSEDGSGGDVVMLLVEKGANLDMKDRAGMTPLDRAKEEQEPLSLLSFFSVDIRPSIVEYLEGRSTSIPSRKVDERAQQKHPDHDSKVLQTRHKELRKACYKGTIEDVIRLVDKGADVNFFYDDGETPLFFAVTVANVDMCRYLLDNGSNINHTDKYGSTAMHYACMGGRGQEDVVKLLYERGASLNSLDIKDRTPLDYAKSKELGLMLGSEDNRSSILAFLEGQ